VPSAPVISEGGDPRESPATVGVRPARASDVARIHQLIVDLATYERAAEEVRSTPAQLHEALFGPQPAAYALVAEVDDTVVGFALYFRNFSTWEGVHGIYLEDLYVAPEQRGLGLGKALLAALAQIAVERGYARLEWAVLKWNQPSIDFYDSLGAVPMDEWTVYRLAGPALQRVASAPPPPEARRAVPTRS
jgi:GNAT superfamily N-acetyltransferase